MKKIISLAVLVGSFLISAAANAEYVDGYTRSNGTYVNGYERSDRNGTTSDNYSTRGNVNPYTGQRGYTQP
jgi:hypothetical protein